jgi:catechol 2,3-dioxygenase-like lactoylglutathione lyase family enzyme
MSSEDVREYLLCRVRGAQDYDLRKEEFPMRASIFFAMGLLLGAAITTGSAQQEKLPGVVGVNHIAMSVENFDEAFAFYTQKMGFHEVETLRDDKGQPTLAFVQASRNTFLELAPSNANRPPGLTHFGLQVADMNAAVAALKQRGVTVSDPRTVGKQWVVANATGPGGIRIELTELGPESPLTQASDTWK